MEPWLSWTIALGIGGGAAYYYTQTGKPKGNRTVDKAQQPASGKRRQDRSQQLGSNQSQSTSATATSSGNGELTSTKKRNKNRSKQALQAKPAVEEDPAEAVTVSEPEDEDQGWAEQLRAAQKGVSVNGPRKAGKEGKSKDSKQNQSGIASGSESKGSREARDELMDENTDQQPSGTNVSDMLEVSTAGPSVLRLTGEAKSQKAKVRAASPEKETKKQRQNRKKVEEKKVAREQDEQERKVLQENQRRTAREARGEPAKNGVPAAPPAQSAWADKSKSTNGVVVNGKGPAAEQTSSEDNSLLDTFDHDTVSNTSSNGPPTSSTTPASTASAFGSALPSNHAQQPMQNQADNNAGWNEVSKGRKGKKKAVAPEETNGADHGASKNNASSGGSAPIPPPAILGGYGDSFVHGMTSKKFHEGDSDWFVE